MIYVNVNGRYDGYSYVDAYFNDEKDIEEYVKDQRLKLLSDEEYLKLVRKGKSDTFYMIEEI